MDQKIYEMIKEAEMILIGVGEEFSPEFPKRSGDMADAWLEPYERSSFYAQIPREHEVIRAYDKLRELVGAKPYFVVTMNTDDLIYRSKLEHDLIVAPCGSMQKMQCAEHIVDAGEIRERVLAEAGKKISFTDAEVKEKQVVPAEGKEYPEEEVLKNLAVCPVCGALLQFHTIAADGYLEEGYLPQWNKYTRWLSCTLNRKLCVLELGVGFRFPQVVRFPFEKAAAYNRKASMIRVNSKFPQLPEEMSQRGVSVAESPVQFLLNY